MFSCSLRQCACALALLAGSTIASAQWMHLGPVTAHETNGPTLTAECGPASVRIQAVSDHVVRVRLAPDGQFDRDFSWAVVNGQPQGRFSSVREDDTRITASTGSVQVSIDKAPCRLTLTDADGNILAKDDAGRGMAWWSAFEHADTAAPHRPVRVWQELPPGTDVFGLGEKTGGLNKAGRSWIMWNSDTAAYGSATDPLYKSIPFFIVARGERFAGVFFDNPWRTTFDLGQHDRGLLSFGAEGGELDYYVIAGPHPKDVIRRYTELTGRLPLPPKWALGYHQCRHSYYPEARVREIARTFREKRIPCDVLYFDIEYMDAYRCFTWHPERFPDPKGLMDDLHEMGFHTVAIIDPGLGQEPGNAIYDQGTALDAWLKRPDGQPYVGRVWPEKAVWPDFTNPAVRDWWADLFPPFLAACGVDGIWNDMNEPSDFTGFRNQMPLDVQHDNEGQPASHRACHNVYGMQMIRATLDGLRRARPNERPFSITRATYAGGQRHGAVWTGDNLSTWEHLGLGHRMLLGLGVSGFPFCGPDIGGFIIGATPELYARWIQVGSLYPFSRTHTAMESPDQEPWSFGPEVERIARQALEERYALLPHLYTLFEEASRTGLPIMRPLWLEFPQMRGWAANWMFMVGPDLLAVPIVWPAARNFEVRLPPGAWYDYRTGTLYRDGQEARVDAESNRLPLFVRAGAIIPMQSTVQNTTETPEQPLIIDVWPFGVSEGHLYEDDGITLAYTRGQHRRTRFQCSADDDSIELTMLPPEGDYVPPPRTPLVRIHGPRRELRTYRVETSGTRDLGFEEPARRKASIDLSFEDQAPAELRDRFYKPGAGAWEFKLLPDDGSLQKLIIRFGAPVQSEETTPVGSEGG